MRSPKRIWFPTLKSKDGFAAGSLANARMNLEVAQMTYDARTKARLSQRERGDLIGTLQSVIARLEDAGSTGRPLSMPQRIGNALGQRLELRFCADKPKKSQTGRGGCGSESLISTRLKSVAALPRAQKRRARVHNSSSLPTPFPRHQSPTYPPAPFAI